MKRLWLILLLCFPLLAHGDVLDDEYFQIYKTIQEAESLEQNGQPKTAGFQFRDAYVSLQRFQKSYPGYNPQVIRFRLDYLAGKLQEHDLSAQPEAGKPTPARPSSLDAERTGSQIDLLNEEIRSLQQDKATLESRLQEAQAQPAAPPGRELERAETKIQALQKERDLLKAQLDAERTRKSPSEDAAAAPDVSKLSPRAQKKMKQLELDRDEARQQLKAALRKLGDMETSHEQELKSSQALLGKLRAAEQERGDLEKALEAKRQELSSLRSEPVPEDRSQVKKLERDRDRLEKEAKAAAKKLASLQSDLNREISAREDALSRLAELEKDRNDLARRLHAATKEIQAVQSNPQALEVQNLQDQVVRLRSRLAVLEAQPVPYTAEEMALFHKPEPTQPLTNPLAGKKPIRELPPGSATLVAEAQRAFADRQYEVAERRYLEVVHKEETNALALANLAAIQIEMGKEPEAEAQLKKALASNPQDDFSWNLLGILKFRQGQFDEALDNLSQAARLNPENPETQNYLGIALGQKGQRGPAETALRKAIQLKPDYASAHHNLAVIYATQNPPYLELARFHYQKALGLGHPANPELEKTMGDKK